MSTLLRIFKILWIGLWAGLATIVIFIPIVVTSFLSPTGNLPFTVSKVWAWMMLKVTRVRLKSRGNDNIRQGQSYIIISNHQSLFDILALVVKLGIQFRWIIKKELRKVPLFGFALYKSRNIFIDRSDRKRAVKSINEGIKRLSMGASVMFFAEGTRSPDGKIHKFKKGGFATAVESGLPILPVTVNGSRKILPKKALAFNPGVIELVIGKPIVTEHYTHDNLKDLMDKTRNIIVANFNPDYPEKVTS
ncbi:MAG: 1-acyl-sn-glycerol-3-phosphate acyltransferase [Deltaproteobacteria bacterium]|nr:1-acyl-sn-glycerol-3-phosphate acyltransferase [Deltaproteobacteria bacterium]